MVFTKEQQHEYYLKRKNAKLLNIAEPIILCSVIEKPVEIILKKRIYKKCEHGKRKERCIDCGGYEICEHKKRKTDCIKCGGISICEHNTRKRCCKYCLGSQICEHTI